MPPFTSSWAMACRVSAAALIVVVAALVPAQAAETLRIGGTGSALGALQRLTYAFRSRHPDMDVIVLPSLGSSGGIKALIADRIGLAVSARPLQAAEAAAGITEREFARTPLVFATHAGTAADGVTLAEVTGAYRGDITTWPDGSRLRPVMRPAAEVGTTFLRELSPAMDKAVDVALARNDLFVAINDQDNAKALEDIRGSLGLITVGQMRSEKRDLKALTFDGKAGTTAAVSAGTYPYVTHLYLMTGAAPSPAVTAFLAFLHSAEGERLLDASGYLPPASAR